MSPGACLLVVASPGEVITTMVNGKEETRNIAQETDYVVSLAAAKRRVDLGETSSRMSHLE